MMTLDGLKAFLPALLGALTVLQAGLIRKIAAKWGLPTAVLMSASILWLCTATLVLTLYFRPIGPSFLQIRLGHGLQIWYLVPGLIGLTLLFGGPWAISKWGASYTYVLIVFAQLAASALWDYKMEGISISRERFAGAVLAGLGVWLSSRGGR